MKIKIFQPKIVFFKNFPLVTMGSPPPPPRPPTPETTSSETTWVALRATRGSTVGRGWIKNSLKIIEKYIKSHFRGFVPGVTGVTPARPCGPGGTGFGVFRSPRTETVSWCTAPRYGWEDPATQAAQGLSALRAAAVGPGLASGSRTGGVPVCRPADAG